MERTDKHETHNLNALFVSASSYYKKSLDAI